MNIIPEKLPFQNFYPILKTLIHPLPKAFFNKEFWRLFIYIIDAIYGFRNIYKEQLI